MDQPKETFTLEVKWHFDTAKEREDFRNILMSRDVDINELPLPQPLTFKFSSFFSHCKKCGRPRWMGTLGHSDMPNASVYRDRCKPAYWHSCQSWQKKGGWKENAELGSRDKM